MGVDWSSPEVENWKNEARERQRILYLTFGDYMWDAYKEDEYDYITQKLLFAIAGPPPSYSLPEGVVENSTSAIIKGYDPPVIERAKMLRNLVIEASETKKVFMAFFFLTVKTLEDEYEVPVFRVHRVKSDTMWFFDIEGRKYTTMDDFIASNTLPKCFFCYPKYGYYSCSKYDFHEFSDEASPLLDFAASPVCSTISRTGRFFDSAGAVTGLVAAGVGIGSFIFPVIPAGLLALASVGGSSAGAYGAVRSLTHLYDRGVHGQSIAFNSRETIGCWLSIVGSIISVGSTVGIGKAAAAARTGSVMTPFTRALVTGLNFGSLSVSGIGLVVHLDKLIEKKKGGRLSSLDVLQFATSVFFFTHSAMNVKTASTIIEETQKDFLKSTRKDLPEGSRNNFKRFDKTTHRQTRGTPMERRAGTIRELNKIDNRDQFFTNLGGAMKDVKMTRGSKVSFKDGHMVVNDQLLINPAKFNSMDENSRKAVVEATNDYNSGKIDRREFDARVRDVRKEERLQFNMDSQERLQKTAHLYGAESFEDIKVDGKNIFKDASEKDKNRYASATAKSDYSEGVLNVSNEVAKKGNCSSLGERASIVEYTNGYIDREANSPAEKAALRNNLSNPNSQEYKTFMCKYNHDLNQVKDAKRGSNLCFETDHAALQHYTKHREDCGGQLSAAEYFDQSNRLFTSTNEQKSSFTQDGGETLIEYHLSDLIQLFLLFLNLSLPF